MKSKNTVLFHVYPAMDAPYIAKYKLGHDRGSETPLRKKIKINISSCHI